jgi:hypothetical protein
MATDLLLLHKLRIRTIINNITSKDGSCQESIDFFRIGVLKLGIENEVISFRSQIYGGFFPQ